MQQGNDDVMTIQEVLKLLKISRTTLHRLRTEGVIPSYKIGGSVRFKRNEIEEYLDSTKQ